MTATLERYSPSIEHKPSSKFIDSLTHGEILPVGTISHVYTTSEKAATSWRDDPEELRRRVYSMNTPEYFREIFFKRGLKENGTMVHSVNQLEDGRLSFSQPTSPYAEVGLLVMGTTREALYDGLEKDGDRPIPLNWTGLKPATRFAYIASQVELLKSMHEFAQKENAEGENKKAVIMQNSASVGAPDTSQSIFLPHFHATVHNLNNLEASDEIINKMAEEQTILKDEELGKIVIPRIKGIVDRGLKGRGIDGKGVEIVQRNAPPFGFAVSFGADGEVTVDNMTSEKNLKKILTVKEYIHKGYTRIAKLLAEQTEEMNGLSLRYGLDEEKGLTEQPSYREIMDIDDDGNLRLIYSPMLLSRGGPVESCDVRLDRQKDESFLNGIDVARVHELHREHAVDASIAVEDYETLAYDFEPTQTVEIPLENGGYVKK